jgi:hypothetical protein
MARKRGLHFDFPNGKYGISVESQGALFPVSMDLRTCLIDLEFWTAAYINVPDLSLDLKIVQE